MADRQWIVDAAADLQALTGPHSAKKRNTIIQLVDARIAGRPDDSVWRRSDTCSANIFYSKWSKDPTFAKALASVEGKARTWHDTRSVRALANAKERLALASPTAVAKLIESMNIEKDDQIILRAAIAILDRAGIETAPKSSSTVKGYAVVSPADWDDEPTLGEDDG